MKISSKIRIALFGLLSLALLAQQAEARTLIKSIARIKGQEENTLRGLGLVVGLNGTGDSGDSLPTLRALARAMELMGNPVSRPDLRGNGGLRELEKSKNVALVWVSATVPRFGGRVGDQLNCYVSAISAKSLEGGRLVFAALQGPNLNDPRVFALAEGRIRLDDPNHPTEGSIHSGCRLEQDIFNAFQKDGKITVVIDENHAGFQVATAIAESINTQLGWKGKRQSEGEELAVAINSANVVVEIPEAYRDVPVQFVAQVMDLPVFELTTEARVVINERAGTIVIGGDVEIGAAVVTHENITIETVDEAFGARFVDVDPGETAGPKLKALVETLNAVHVPTQDIIDIIKGLDRDGKLHGRLIIE